MGDVSAAQLFGAQFCGAEFGRAILFETRPPPPRYRDSNGYLGYSADEKKAAEPRLVALQGGALIKQIASGADHTLAVGANGVDVYSWGCGDGDAHQAAHPLRDAARLAVGRQAGAEVAVAVAELAVLVAAPAPHLPLGGEREHVRAAARQRVDRVAQQPLDQPRLEHRAALAGAERAVLALPPREDAAVGVERER